MLARRVVTRPATTIGRGSLLPSQRRFIHPSRSQLQALPRPNTWLAKIRFRADGKPRSKLIALGFSSLILFDVLFYAIVLELNEDGRTTMALLAKMIFIQQTDITYDSVNFDDPISTLSYFKKLFKSFTRLSEEEVEHIFKDLMRLIKMRTNEVQAQHIMRSTAKKIHDTFRELNRNSLATSANVVLFLMQDAVHSLIDLMHDDPNYYWIRDHTKKDAQIPNDYYEVLG